MHLSEALTHAVRGLTLGTLGTTSLRMLTAWCRQWRAVRPDDPEFVALEQALHLVTQYRRTHPLVRRIDPTAPDPFAPSVASAVPGRPSLEDHVPSD